MMKRPISIATLAAVVILAAYFFLSTRPAPQADSQQATLESAEARSTTDRTDSVLSSKSAQIPPKGAVVGPQTPATTSQLHTAQSKNFDQLPHSAMERSMLSNGMVNEQAMKMLEAKRFDTLLTQFETEQMGTTTELTAAYRGMLEESLGAIATPKQIDRVVCGTNLCFASIRSPSSDWYRAWYESLPNRSKLPVTTLTGNTVDLGGTLEYRLMFSTSGSVKGFTGSAPRS